MTEEEYRALPSSEYYSSSYIKAFDDKGPKSLITKVDYDNSGTRWGSVVDTMLFSNYEFDDRYYVSQVEKSLTTTEIKLVRSITNVMDKESLMNDEFLKSKEFIENCLIIMKEMKLWNNITKENLLLDKINENLLNHVKERVIASKKKIISTKDYMDSLATSNMLKTHEFTKDYLDNSNIKEKQVLFQTAILFEFKRKKFKSLLDIILIDHKNKTIRVLDLKTGSSSILYFKFDFFKYRYDIQAGIYTKALEEYVKINGLKDYQILNPIYLYTCRFTPEKPLPFLVTQEIVEGSFFGFTNRITGQKYKGILELVEEIEWYREHKKYDYTKKVYENKQDVISPDTMQFSMNLPTENIYDLYGKNKYGRYSIGRPIAEGSYGIDRATIINHQITEDFLTETDELREVDLSNINVVESDIQSLGRRQTRLSNGLDRHESSF